MEIYDQNFLKSRLEYRDGKLFWKKRKGKKYNSWNALHSGKRAGSPFGERYWQIGFRIQGKSYSLLEHRVVFMIFHGFLPEEVDHINGDGFDNRIENLRVCNKIYNKRNTPKKIGCTSKYKGVAYEKDRGKFKACIKDGKKSITIGRYEDELAAAKAYDEKAKEIHGNYARLNFPQNIKVSAVLTRKCIVKNRKTKRQEFICPQDVIEKACKKNNVTFDQVKSAKVTKALAKARYEICRELYGKMKTKDIATLIKKHSTTVSAYGTGTKKR